MTTIKLSPSEQFLQEISPYFFSKGFTFKKTQKKFITDFEHGKKTVYLSFLNMNRGVEVQMLFGLEFPLLEKIYANLKGWEKKVDTGYSIGTELIQLPEIRFSKQQFYFPLYNTQTFKTDDKSISNIATFYIEAFEKHAEPFFSHYSHLSNVEKQLNKLPISYPVITNWTDKHIVFGLLLASLYSKDNYDNIFDSYKDYTTPFNNATELYNLLVDTDSFIKRTDIKSHLKV